MASFMVYIFADLMWVCCRNEQNNNNIMCCNWVVFLLKQVCKVTCSFFLYKSFLWRCLELVKLLQCWFF